jgi:phage terminase large subunit
MTKHQTDKFVHTTAINKIRRLKKRVRVIQGGTSAGKTYGIIPVLIQRAINNPGKEISIVSETIPHLRKGALRDFLNIMKDTGRFIEKNYNKTLLTYTFTNGSYIEFFSADQEGKVRGPRRQILYVNEANNLSFDTYHQLAIRTSEDIYLDYNPSARFWVHEEIIPDEDTDFIILTYKDNEALSDTIIKEIEKAREKAKTSDYWANWWKVYGLGQVGSLEGVIFTEWEQIDIIPPTARLLGFGLDFGYTNDPTACIAAYKWNKKIIFDQVIYQTGLMNNEIAKLLRAYGCGSFPVYCDSAEPKSIAELKQRGIRAIGAKKGKDSISYGINLLNQERFFVTSESLETIKDLRAYIWAKERKTGKAINEPIDLFNHAPDAMRYWAMHNIRPHGIGKRKGVKRRN